MFLDCGRLLNAVKSFLMISAGISLAGYGIVFVFLYIFSDRIVKPIADGYEKQKQFITNVGHDLKTPLTIIDADTDIPEMDYGENEWCQDIKTDEKAYRTDTGTDIPLEHGRKRESVPND